LTRAPELDSERPWDAVLAALWEGEGPAVLLPGGKDSPPDGPPGADFTGARQSLGVGVEVAHGQAAWIEPASGEQSATPAEDHVVPASKRWGTMLAGLLTSLVSGRRKGLLPAGKAGSPGRPAVRRPPGQREDCR
jgi:hypothetical protein